MNVFLKSEEEIKFFFKAVKIDKVSYKALADACQKEYDLHDLGYFHTLKGDAIYTSLTDRMFRKTDTDYDSKFCVEE